MPNDISNMYETEDESLEVLLDEIKNKEQSLRNVVFQLHKSSVQEQAQRTTLITKAEQYYHQAKENILQLKDDLALYEGNKKQFYQLEMKKLEKAIAQSYDDLSQMKLQKNEMNERATSTTPRVTNISPSSTEGKATTSNGSTTKVGKTKSPTQNHHELDGSIIVMDDHEGSVHSFPPPMQQGHSRVDEILTVYDENNEILNNMIRIGDETIQIGASAAEKLRDQSKRMDDIQKNLDELGDGLKRAKKELNGFIRGTNCDKAVICIFIIVILLMVAVIIGWQVAKYVCIKGVTNTCVGGFSNSSSSSS
ncbi:hypothetical protein C9374_012410 [Naegleria lovaniensis]|uniref:t-SNARE coiled-coil homology domain-containing protein n=1 Tax=Naegleria lovaniensis TaxID=51637 RepID=A0AA88GZQ6_NAELO|nr:uncharacterized protein C9374_012410 [Naegleria lovaniensis]KAG2392158.1 hypothetical protein C9374_012410 [Naegleria lovaniensis]